MHKVFIAIFLPLFLVAACTAAPVSRQAVEDPDIQLLIRLKDPTAPADVDADNQALEKVLHYLAEENNINVVIDWKGLADAGVEKTNPVTIHLHNASIETAITVVLEQVPSTSMLDFASSGGVLYISRQAELSEHQKYVSRIYDIGDLLARPSIASNAKEKNRRIAYLMDLIVYHVASTTWRTVQYPEASVTTTTSPARPTDSAGTSQDEVHTGTGVIHEDATGDGTISAFDSKLVISHTPKVHAKIIELLNELRTK